MPRDSLMMTMKLRDEIVCLVKLKMNDREFKTRSISDI